jgi:uncharacterized protein YbjT (DUF2867 family)
MAKPILILGSTGTVGTALTGILAAAGERVRAATRRPGDYGAPGPSVQPVHGDPARPRTLDSAAAAAAVAGPGSVYSRMPTRPSPGILRAGRSGSTPTTRPRRLTSRPSLRAARMPSAPNAES